MNYEEMKARNDNRRWYMETTDWTRAFRFLYASLGMRLVKTREGHFEGRRMHTGRYGWFKNLFDRQTLGILSADLIEIYTGQSQKIVWDIVATEVERKHGGKPDVKVVKHYK